jgi:dinuclear metal center YbgI/SA1388 family protein
MKIIELTKYLESWVPKNIAWEKDNVGLQAGSLERGFSNILLCLESAEDVIKEAVRKKCKLIISHHPLIFNPLKKIDLQNDKTSKQIEQLIKKEITLISYHTNLDFTKDGVSFSLAKELKLKKIKFLSSLKSNQYKLVVFVPNNAVEKVASAIFNAGGGIIGEYKNCSFKLNGMGTFLGSEKSNPSIGQKQKFESVNEVRLEVLVNEWKLKEVIKAIIEHHPYEEPAYDIYPLINENVNYGMGAIGELEKELSERDFLKYASSKIKSPNLKFVTGGKKKIKKVAVCGGSGSDLLNAAVSQKADALITADIKYHTFQDAAEKILLIDAGHYETEIHSLKELKIRIEKFIKEKKLNSKVFIYSKSTSPIKFYSN